MWSGGNIGCLVSAFERGSEYKSVMGAVDARNAE